MEPDVVPRLDGWMTFPEIAALFGMTKQGIFAMAFRYDAFKTIHKVGDRPTYLVKTTEVRRVKARKDAEAAHDAEVRASRAG